MSAKGACRILERVLARVQGHRIPPLLALTWAAVGDEDLPGHTTAIQLVMAEAGGTLTKWWGQGRTTEELTALFSAAHTAAQIRMLEEI